MTWDEIEAKLETLLEDAEEKIKAIPDGKNIVTKEYLEKRLYDISKELDNKYRPIQMRLRIVELLTPYAGHEANALIKETEAVYNYIMKGNEDEKG